MEEMKMAEPILIVDDEKNIRLMLSETLKAIELETEMAGSGEEALTKVRERNYGAILLDLMMPGIGGMAFLRRLREMRITTPVIVITAHGTVDSAVEAMKLGAADFIQKPFVPSEIRQMVNAVLDREAMDEDQAETYPDMMNLARKAINDRRFDAAAMVVKNALATDPSNPDAFNVLGALAEIRGDCLEAQRFYRAALELDPTYGPARQNLDRTTRISSRKGIAVGLAAQEKV
jgi:DNA-binding response OmpR family regulator